MKFRLAVILGVAVVMLHGCAGDTPRPDAPEEARVEGVDPGARAEGAPGTGGAWVNGIWVEGAPLDEGSQLHPLEDPESPLSERVIYFAFDSAELSSESRERLAAHARFLAAQPDVTVILEGHTDERGSREYNLALGERRGLSVEQLLLLQGVARNQLQVISFGEERPVALGSDEESWRLNRRVELLYSGY